MTSSAQEKSCCLSQTMQVDAAAHQTLTVPLGDCSCTDSALSQMTSSSLSISSNRDTHSTTSRYLPRRQYEVGVQVGVGGTVQLQAASISVDDGVPGFPDFPSMWGGEEGGARTPEQKLCVKSNDSQRSIILTLKRRIIRREAVNTAGMARGSRKKQGVVKQQQFFAPRKKCFVVKSRVDRMMMKKGKSRWIYPQTKLESKEISTICQGLASVVFSEIKYRKEKSP